MKLIAFLASTLMAASSFANTMIYACEPLNDDGDAYGETLVIGVPDAKDGVKSRTLNLLSDYMGASSGISESSIANSASITFSKFDTSAYDSNGSFVKNLKINASKTLIEKGPAQTTIKLVDENREGVSYSCKRISE